MRVKSVANPAGDRRVFRLGIPLALLAALLLAALALSVSWGGSARADDHDDDDGSGGEAVPRQIVVKLTPRVEIGQINSDRRYRTVTLDRLLGSRKIYLLRVRVSRNPATVLERMQNDRRLIYAEPNFRTESPEGDRQHRARPGGEPTPSSDPAPYRDQYAIGAMNLSGAHGITRGRGSVVAVLDTGMQRSHPELSGRLTRTGYDFIDDDRTPADGRSATDADRDGELNEMVGHGTHVAGIVRLTAPGARIMPVRALNSDGGGNVFVLAEAINYAGLNGANVINLSLGASQESEFLADIVEDWAGDDDDDPGRVVFAAAAGNGNSSALHHPAATDGVLAVTSVDRNEAKSSFANYGGWVEIASPGSEIHSPFPNNIYASWDGTSMATPFIAGQAALMFSERPRASAACVGNAITASARPLTDPSLGAGHADAGAGVKHLRANGCAAGDDGAGGDD